MKLINVMNN